MKTSSDQLFNEPLPRQLLGVINSFDSPVELAAFLRDVMTEKEIREIAARFEAAKLLANSVPYTEISRRTKLSSRTIARISDWMKNGSGGYKLALAHRTHTSPARAE